MDLLLLLLLSLPLTLALLALSCWFAPTHLHLPRKRLPPGSLGWPFVGESLHYFYSASSARPHTFFQHRNNRYGEVFRTHLFGSDTAVFMDPAISKFVLQNEGKLFQSKYPRALVSLFGEYTLLNVHGNVHKKLYGIALRLMSPENLRQHFMEDIETYVLRVLESWRGTEVVLVEKEVKHFSLSLMAKQLLSFEAAGKETEQLTTNCNDIIQAVLSMPVNLPWSTYNKGLKARKRITKLLNQVLNDRRKQQPGGRDYTDVLSRLMTWDEFPLTDEQIRDFLLFLVFAGHETTAMTITCAIKFLADCPLALQQLREEHDKVSKRTGNNGGRLTWEDYKAMTFTQDVIKETLRIANLTPMLFRAALQDVEIKGYTIPKGWSVIVPVIGLHLEEDHFPDPQNFNPWRWEENAETASFIPFGGGPRYCAGSELGRLETAIFLHHLVTKFDWEGTAPSSISWFPFTNFPNHLPVRVQDRNVNAQA